MRLVKQRVEKVAGVERGVLYHIVMACPCDKREQLEVSLAFDYGTPRRFIAAELWAAREHARQEMARHQRHGE